MKQRKSLGAPKSFLLSLAVGAATEVLFALIAASVLAKTDAPENFIMPVSIAVPVLSAAIAGFLCAALNKKSGLLCGAAAGALLSLLLLVVGLFIGNAEDTPLSFTAARCALSIISGAVCGFLTVYAQNGKKRKKPH